MFWNRKKEVKPQSFYWATPSGEYSVISGKVLDAEHSLIAGAAGSGKSTFLHSVMQAFLLRYAPCEAKLVLLDPKVVELARYKDLPHVIRYESEEEGILSALEEVIAMMAARYEIMADRGEVMYTGARIYVVIEELADLMCCPLKVRIRIAIQRLAQKGRAAGIHVIMATQSPSRKTLPAEITLNISGRFGLACESAIESRQIVGVNGCEDLPDHGYCIYKYRRNVQLCELPFVTIADVQPLINYWMSDRCKRYA